MDVRSRYELAKSLAQKPSDENARRLIEMLSDEGSFELDDDVWLYDSPTPCCT